MKTKGSLRRILDETRNIIDINAIAKENQLKSREVLAEELVEKLGDKSPSLETLKKLISQARNHPPDKLDTPWTIGACLKYDIPDFAIPMLIEIQRRTKAGTPLNIPQANPQKQKAIDNANKQGEREPTIRQARWFARLYHSLEMVIEETKLNKPPIWKQGIHFIIASQYAERERVSEMLGKDYPDTSELDKLYFINKDLDIVEGMLINSFPPDAREFYQREIKGKVRDGEK